MRNKIILLLTFRDWLTLLGFLVASCALAQAQGVPDAFTDYRFYARDEGLPSRTVRSAALDQDGLLWLSTDKGLSRFDGYGTSNFPPGRQSFDGELHLDAEGFLLVLPQNDPDSVEVFDPRRLQASGYRLSALVGAPVLDRQQKKGEPLFIATSKQLYRFSANGTVSLIHGLPSGLSDKLSLLEVSDTAYTLLDKSSGRLYRYRQGKLSVAELDYPRQDRLTLAYCDGRSRIWMAFGTHLYRLTQADSLLPIEEFANGAPITLVAEDDHHRLFFGSIKENYLRGLIAIDESGTHPVPWLIPLENRTISISGKDFSQAIYLSTHTGLYIVQFSEEQDIAFERFLYSSLRPGKFGHVIRGFTADDQGNVFTHKDSYMPFWFKVDRQSRKLDSIPIRDNEGKVPEQHGCGANLLNYQGDIYGTNCTKGELDTGFVYRYRPATGEWRRWRIPALDQLARTITPGSREGELLVVCEDARDDRRGRLYRLYPDRDTLLPATPPGSENFVRGRPKVSVKDPSGDYLWIGAQYGGLIRWNLKTDALTYFQFSDESTINVSAILIRSSDEFYVGTFNRGLFRFQPETGEFTHIGGVVEEGDPPPADAEFLRLPNNSVAAMDITPEGYLLLATFNGLVLRSPEGTAYTFTTNHGLPSNEFNTPSLFYHAPEDRYYAGGINGFVSFKIGDLIPRKSPYQPVLLRYTELDERVGYETRRALAGRAAEALTVRPSVAYFGLEFGVPDYRAPEQNRYQTRLVGYDPDWTPTTASNSVRYTRLPPGDYTFELRAFDGRGWAATETLSLPVKVLRPWYKQSWFYGTLFCLLLLGWYLMDQNRLSGLRKDLSYRHQLAQLELRALRQQLNPHFIYNAMGAIREYVLHADRKDAAAYLTDFSRLMRLFLEASRNRFTTVNDEVELLRRYVRLEQLRFPDRFTAAFEVDPSIDPELDEVPSLLLQPIVENAIIHGLGHRESGGQLLVRIARHAAYEDLLICTVADDGIGRKRSRQRYEQSTGGHISRATEILRERQAVLAEDDSVQLEIFTHDLHPEADNTGTVVSLFLNYGAEKIPADVLLRLCASAPGFFSSPSLL